MTHATPSSATFISVLKGIEDFKLRGKQGAEMLQKVEELTKKHLQVVGRLGMWPREL